jgi:hypothetical protein
VVLDPYEEEHLVLVFKNKLERFQFQFFKNKRRALVFFFNNKKNSDSGFGFNY